MDSTEALLGTLAELDHLPGKLSDQQAQSFFSSFSLQDLFGLFAAPTLKDSQLHTAVTVLSRLLKTQPGLAILPGALPYLDAALKSPRMPLRKMAAQQYGMLLLRGSTSPEALQQRSTVLAQLVSAMQDKDTGVAGEAESALAEWAASEPIFARALAGPSSAEPMQEDEKGGGGSGSVGEDLSQLGSSVSDLAGSKDATLRLRALSLLVSACVKAAGKGAGSGAAVAAVQAGGVLRPLLSRELEEAGSDPLAALSALEMVAGLAELRDGGLTLWLCSAVGAALPALLSEPLLRAGALRTALVLLREGLETERGTAPMQQQQQEGGGGGRTAPSEDGGCGTVLGLPLFRAMRAILDDTGTDSAEDEAAALDAAGSLAESRLGAEQLMGDQALTGALLERALGRAASPSVRLAALHTLGLTAGMKRAQDWEERSAALLSKGAEEALRVGCYQAAASSGNEQRTPAEAVLSLLQQPFPELRIATYHAASALALRPWFAAEVCRCSELLDRVLDPGSETSGQTACDWRFTLLTALWSCIKANSNAKPAGGCLSSDSSDAAISSTLSAASSRVRAAVLLGPYGSGGTGQGPSMTHTHLVATIP